MALPEPSFITRDPEAVAAEMIAAYEAATGRTLQPAQVERVLIDLVAYRESLLRVAIQEAAKQNLVEYAIFPMLDYLGELVGVTRLAAQAARCGVRFYLTEAQTFDVTVPAGTRIETKDGLFVFETEFNLTVPAGSAYGDVSAICQTAGASGNGYVAGYVNGLLDVVANINSAANTETTSGGSDEETDDALRQRIKLAPERFSNAGSYGAYRYWAMSSHPDIVDVSVVSPGAGTVNIYPLTKTGTPSQTILDAVAAVCSAETVRPLCDLVQVAAPTEKAFAISADISLYDWADSVTVQDEVAAALGEYVAGLRSTLGRDVILSRIVAVINGIQGVYKTDLAEPAADEVNALNEWSNCSAITVNVIGFNNG